MLVSLSVGKAGRAGFRGYLSSEEYRMSCHSKGHLGRLLATLLATITLLSAFATLAAAQDQPAPATAQDKPFPKWELYGGYSFWDPGADVHGVLPLGLLPITSQMNSNPRGAGAAVTYDFNRWFGLTLDASDHWGIGKRGTAAACCRDADFANLSLGPKFTFRTAHLSPFLEALAGDHRLYPEDFHNVQKLGFMFGGGLDLNLSRHVALRVFRADYVMSSYRYGPSSTTPSTDLSGVRLQAGLNLMFGGGAPPVSPSAACSVQPIEVFAGEPVTATATGSNFTPKRTVKYDWSGTGLKVSGSSASTQVDTTGLQPGSYQVAARLSDGSRNGVASCSAAFTVRASRPPMISCASDPKSVAMGGPSTISSNASSPDGRVLTYSYTTSAGNISGSTSTATLDTAGAQPGIITVTCNVSDDRNPPLMASSTTTVNVQAPPPPPNVSAIERRLALHSVYFATAKPTVEHPDAGLLPSQEEALSTLAADFRLYLQSRPDVLLTLEGHADPRGSVEYNQALSERRVNRVKRFLVEQGVPAANIQTKSFGEQQNLTDAEVKDAVERNPELSAEERQRVLDNMRMIILASNRRVDITLSDGGQASQESVREYPFNAADSLTLLDIGGGTTKRARPPAKEKNTAKP
jgi:outer membrane protein OmpA-like peptidoglycan-associated protein/opacity protein-like surface antigen